MARKNRKKKKKKAEPRPAAEDQVEVHELSDTTEDLASLIAEVVVLDSADPLDSERPDPPTVPSDAVDAVIEEDVEGDDVEQLIALTAAGGEPAEVVDESPVVSLDDDGTIELLDEDVDAVASAQEEADPTDSPPAPAAEPDLDGAIDLGPDSTPELRERLLAQALAHSELQDARYRVPFSGPRTSARWKGALASLLLLVAAVLAAVPPTWARPELPASLDASARTAGLRAALLLQAQQVDAYRVRYQRLPDSLDELPDRLGGLRLVTSGNRAYQLVGYVPGGGTIIYDSSGPALDFDRVTRPWAATP